MSRRSPEDLTDEDWHKLRHALDLLRGDPGEYGAAGRALHELMKDIGQPFPEPAHPEAAWMPRCSWRISRATRSAPSSRTI